MEYVFGRQIVLKSKTQAQYEHFSVNIGEFSGRVETETL